MTITIHVTGTQAVVILERSVLHWIAGFAHGVKSEPFSRLCLSGDLQEPHFGFRLRAHQKLRYSVAVQIFKLR